MRPTPQLLTPPKEEEDIYPYRRVWPSIAAEGLLLFAGALVFYIAGNFFGVQIDGVLRLPVSLLVALLPLLLWLLFSYVPERASAEPRTQLLQVLVITALSANAVGIPLLNNFLQVDQWLSLEGSVNRILGYAFTVGIVQEMIKYLVIRYVVWPVYLRTRTDCVAYGAAAAVGYATMQSLQLALVGTTPVDALIIRAFFFTALHFCTSVIVAYGVASSRFNTGIFLVLPFTMFLGAVLTGLAVSLRSGLVNAGFVQGVGTPNNLFGLLFVLALFVVVQTIMAFLLNAQEREVRDASVSRKG